jgi:hypothetical protein
MKKLQSELAKLIKGNPFLELGLREALLNSAAVARLLQPALAARLKKPISTSAIAMALSRMNSEVVLGASSNSRKNTEDTLQFSTSDISIRAGLELVSYPQTPETRKLLEKLYRQIQRKELFATLTEGAREITLIFETQGNTVAIESIGTPLIQRGGVGCIALYFPKQYGRTPGFFQNINVIEIASTSRELLIYIDEQDLQLGFDTLFERFVFRHRNLPASQYSS